MKSIRYFAVAMLCVAALYSQQKYEKPPKVVDDALLAPLIPTATLSPSHDYLMIRQGVLYPPISEVSEPMLRLAGLRINPRNNGPHRDARLISLKLKKVADGAEVRVTMPAEPHISGVEWSPDGKNFVFSNNARDSVELWVGTTATGMAAKVPGVALNTACPVAGGGGGGGRGGAGAGGGGGPVRWVNGGKGMLVRLVPAGRSKAPATEATPIGPNVQQSLGDAKGPVATFEDLLKGQQDEVLYEYYCTSQLAVIDRATSKVTPVGKPAIFATADASPDGKYYLVSRIHKPYDYIHTYQSFPKEVEIWDATGKVVHPVASVPKADNVPINGVQDGPRGFQWHALDPATLVWVEALDGGDSRKPAKERDKVLKLSAPFTGQSTEIVRTEQRYGGIEWTESGKYAILRDSEAQRRRSRTFLMAEGAAPKLLWSLDQRDRYGNPGTPASKTLPTGHRVIVENDGVIFLEGEGASAQGDHPFVDRYDLKTGKKERVFLCDNDAFEQVAEVLDAKGTKFFTRRESPTDPPNYFMRTGGERKALTAFKDPQPQVRGIKKELVKYKRADGVDLSFTLYLPPDYKPGTRLPTFIRAYPYEFDDPATAGQISGSTQRFSTFTGVNPAFYTLLGYAVLDNAAMPVVGDPKTVNDTFVEQIIADAKAAIDKAAEMGVTDPKRVAVGGHSYGAFMTGNLLANCDLFRAGIAESGAYNRTLTPFGFQSERRTFWEVPGVYLKMSPFVHADKIKVPLLMFHGEADDNSGTFPIQSERMYAAMRGNGGTVRLVMLPSEAHGYAARETIEHVLYETIAWLEKYVK